MFGPRAKLSVWGYSDGVKQLLSNVVEVDCHIEMHHFDIRFVPHDKVEISIIRNGVNPVLRVEKIDDPRYWADLDIVPAHAAMTGNTFTLDPLKQENEDATSCRRHLQLTDVGRPEGESALPEPRRSRSSARTAQQHDRTADACRRLRDCRLYDHCDRGEVMRVKFTPLHIQMMLHYYAIAAPYAEHDPLHANSTAVREYRAQLVSLGMLVNVPVEDSPSGYRVTEKGVAYVNALQNVSEPVCNWECYLASES